MIQHRYPNRDTTEGCRAQGRRDAAANAARRSRSASKAAETRARAQASTLKSLGWRAQRVADTAVGAAVSAGEKLTETVKPLRSQTGVNLQISTLRRRASTQLRKAERRGATARRRADATWTRRRHQAVRRLRRNRRTAERQVKSTRGEFERRVDDAQTAAEELARRVRSEAKGIV